MIQIEVLKERKGANSFGTCSACGKESSEDDRMIRLIFSRIIGNARHSTSVCLCFKCAGELMGGIIEQRTDQMNAKMR